MSMIDRIMIINARIFSEHLCCGCPGVSFQRDKTYKAARDRAIDVSPWRLPKREESEMITVKGKKHMSHTEKAPKREPVR